MWGHLKIKYIFLNKMVQFLSQTCLQCLFTEKLIVDWVWLWWGPDKSIQRLWFAGVLQKEGPKRSTISDHGLHGQKYQMLFYRFKCHFFPFLFFFFEIVFFSMLKKKVIVPFLSLFFGGQKNVAKKKKNNETRKFLPNKNGMEEKKKLWKKINHNFEGILTIFRVCN